GPGATGNGDGLLPVNQESGGGLQIETPYLINDPGHGGIQNIAAGSTTFNDVSLVLSGLSAPSGSAGTAMSFGGVVVQPIGVPGSPATFTLKSTNGSAGDLLMGTIADGNINGLIGSTSGAVFSATVTFTGGEIATAANAVGQTGTLSFSLL